MIILLALILLFVFALVFAAGFYGLWILWKAVTMSADEYEAAKREQANAHQ